MQVQIDGHLIQNGSVVDYSLFRENNFSVLWNSSPQAVYTLMVYDISAPSASYPSNSPYLHFLSINIPQSDILRGTTVFPYQPPNPEPGTGVHQYVVELYQQTTLLSPQGIASSRINFPVNSFVANNRLVLVGQLTFGTANYGHVHHRRSHRLPENKESWINPQSTLSEEERKYCRCVTEVAAKQPAECNADPKAMAGHHIGTATCYNPYAVCAASTHTTSRHCGASYEFQNLPDDELRGYASLKGLPIPNPYNRSQLLQTIYNWKSVTGK